MNKTTLKSEMILLFGTMIWGIAFVFQSLGMNYVSPLTFNVERSFVASIFLFISYFIFSLFNKKKKEKDENNQNYKIKDLIIGSIVCGLFLSIGMITQQFGISQEGAGKSGFITALYVIFVPLFGIFLKKKVNIFLLIGIILSVGGLILINYEGGVFSWGAGSWLLLSCAIVFSFQILSVDYFCKKCNPILLTGGQFFVSFIVHIPLMFIFEQPNISNMLKAWLPVLFCGLLSSGIGYTIQVYSQKRIHPTIASLIMSLESVFSLIAGIIILHESYDLLKLLGCLVLFISIIIAQIPRKKAS